MDDNTTRADLAVYSITALITGAVWAVAALNNGKDNTWKN
jgi:hypothetical protein